MGLLESMIEEALKKAQAEADKRSAASEKEAESGSQKSGGMGLISSEKTAKPRQKSSPKT